MNKNIYLIGLMGCGKSSIGALLAETLGVKFIDLDALIEQQQGRRVREIFAEFGEESFRDSESAALASLPASDWVIATGGGIVLREANRARMREGGFVVFIDRPLERILADVDVKGRPLLAKGADALLDIHAARLPLYLASCNLRFTNDFSSSQEAATALAAELRGKLYP